jgi:F0F1-type ATP synthase membrane subunit b/b'
MKFALFLIVLSHFCFVALSTNYTEIEERVKTQRKSLDDTLARLDAESKASRARLDEALKASRERANAIREESLSRLPKRRMDEKEGDTKAGEKATDDPDSHLSLEVTFIDNILQFMIYFYFLIRQERPENVSFLI